jgi:hypothetical protein
LLVREARQAKRSDLPGDLFQTRFLELFCLFPVFGEAVSFEDFRALIMILDRVFLSESVNETAEGTEPSIAA